MPSLMTLVSSNNGSGKIWWRLVRFVALVSLVLPPAQRAMAQSVIAAGLGGSVALQNSPWRFAQGDNPEWKAVNFDDSGWSTTTPSDQTSNPILCKGFCWYRLRVSVPPESRDLSIGLNNIDTSYELFVNGQKIGSHGRMPPHPSNYQSNLNLFPVPDAQVATGKLLIAIRIWVSSIKASGERPTGMSPESTILLGETSELELSREQDVAVAIYTALPGLLNGFFGLLIGIPALLLFRSQRDHREYLWLFGMGASLALAIVFDTATTANLVSGPLNFALYSVLEAITLICNIEFIFAFIRRPVSTVFRVLEWSYVPFVLIVILGSYNFLSPQVILPAITISQLPVNIGIPILLILAYRRGNKEAGLLLIPIFFLEMANYAVVLWNFLASLFSKGALPPIPQIHIGPVAVTISSLFSYMTWLTVGLIILLRSSAIVRERERATGELQAAKAVQDVLMPKLLMATPGFTLQSAYRPAQEVGGDFFHLLPADDGSLRVVIGDVSGKGLKAAMTVALIVGALDRDASQHPGQVLKGLNRILAQHSTGGFATCLCLHITAQGSLTAANAGHFTPYQNGVETAMEGNLPLGLDSDADYDEAEWRVHSDDRLLLFTDGVPEARDARSGELFGFERTNSLIASTKSAEEIANAAQAFGQDDDITVVEVVITGSL